MRITWAAAHCRRLIGTLRIVERYGVALPASSVRFVTNSLAIRCFGTAAAASCDLQVARTPRDPFAIESPTLDQLPCRGSATQAILPVERLYSRRIARPPHWNRGVPIARRIAVSSLRRILWMFDHRVPTHLGGVHAAETA